MNSYNWPVIGQQKIVKFLQKSLDSQHLAHAYLFAGKEHLGKNLLAANFFATILCQDYHQKNKIEAEQYPCQKCVFCQQVIKGIHPDVYYLRRLADKKNISIEQVREMQALFNMSSFLNSYKIVIIDQAESLSESAQNALLKTLEEPTPKTILIILCSDANLLLPTISSRCQVLKLQPVAQDDIFHHLLALGATREQARMFGAISAGQIGLAINFFTHPELFAEYIKQHQQFFALVSGNLVDKFEILNEQIAGFETNLETIDYLQSELNNWIKILRDVVLLHNNSGHLIANLHFQKDLEALAKRYSLTHVLHLINNIKVIKKYLAYNINPRLAVENLVLNF